MKRTLPLWEVFVEYGAHTRQRSKLVYAPTAHAAMKKTRWAKSARPVGDGLNRRLFPELFE